jgi:serine/threonine protein kinase
VSVDHRSSTTPSGAADPLAGTAYRTRSLLGQGSMGLVVEAEHVALGTVVAVKLLHAQLRDRQDFVDRLRIEAQATARLRSPHLALCTDLSVTPAGRPFLVLERLHGRTVAEELKARGALPVDEAIDIARQTLAGLGVVHDAGIVHRDIKPANLFLCAGSDGRRLIKILDFGIAKVLVGGGDGGAPRPLSFPTEEGMTIGTPTCFSPEQARGLPVDARTDLYAVGLLLYRLVTGKGPFDDAPGLLDVMSAHVNVAAVAPSLKTSQHVPEELDAVVLRALSKRPADRFASAAELSAALARVPSGRFDTEPLTGAGPTATPARGAVPARFGTEIMPPPRPAAPARFGTEIMPPPRPSPRPAGPVRFYTEIMARAPGPPREAPRPASPAETASPPAATLAPAPAPRKAGRAGLSALVLALGALAYTALAVLVAWRWLRP